MFTSDKVLQLIVEILGFEQGTVQKCTPGQSSSRILRHRHLIDFRLLEPNQSINAHKYACIDNRLNRGRACTRCYASTATRNLRNCRNANNKFWYWFVCALRLAPARVAASSSPLSSRRRACCCARRVVHGFDLCPARAFGARAHMCVCIVCVPGQRICAVRKGHTHAASRIAHTKTFGTLTL